MLISLQICLFEGKIKQLQATIDMISTLMIKALKYLYLN